MTLLGFHQRTKWAMENLKALTEQAAAGDAGAQYRLAAALEREGRKGEAKTWLGKAAKAGHPGAVYTQATQMLSLPPDQMQPVKAAAMLQRATARGGGAAARQLAVLKALGLGVQKDWAGAVALVVKAAKAGHPAALRELAMLTQIASGETKTASALMRAAALKGDWSALYLGLRRGAGVFSAREGQGLAAQLRAGGAPLSARLSDPVDSTVPDIAIDFTAIEQAASSYCVAQAAPGRALNESPDIVHYKNILTAEECDYLICASASLLTPSRVVNSQTGGADHMQYRSSDGAMVGLLDLDLALIALYERFSVFAGVPFPHCELMGVLRYQPGQQYLPHHDFLPEDAADYSEVKRSGQRTRTLLVSLNEGYGGGETVFPRLGVEYSGTTGAGVLFHNTDKHEAPYPETLHAGKPVLSGEKWLLTLWCRAKPFWFWR